jgi:hypothetical protein
VKSTRVDREESESGEESKRLEEGERKSARESEEKEENNEKRSGVQKLLLCKKEGNTKRRTGA